MILHAQAGDKFVLNIDRATFRVLGWPKPRRIRGRTISIAGHLARGSIETLDAYHRLALAYEKDGASFSRDLLGQFCAAVVDPTARTVILSQDSLGLGKMFYEITPDSITISSDLDLLYSVTGRKGLCEAYFAFHMTATSADRSLTPFEGIYRLAHGWTITISSRGLNWTRPWSPSQRSCHPVEDDLEDQFRSLLDEAVKSTLPSQGRVLCELSGGLDSSSVFATARNFAKDVGAVTYVADRGMAGDDELYADRMIEHCPAPLHRVSIDTGEVIPNGYGGFVSEPHAILYARQFDAMDRYFREASVDVVLSGAVGDVIFEYAGIPPAFIADAIHYRSWRRAVRTAREWAAGRANVRSWTHYLLQIGLPLARRHRRGKSVLDSRKRQIPDWLVPSFGLRHGLHNFDPPQRAPRVAEPGRQHLWESVYDLAAFENGPLYRRLSADFRYPLYFRPLVEFMLNLDFRERRGITGDRRLQRRALGDRLPEAILTRTSKGSAQELRERHLMESDRWYALMTQNPRIVQRGWADAEKWRALVDRARVGASEYSAAFVNAIQTELWLRALERVDAPPPVNLVA
ncbi:MAG: hypothetical protein H7X93_04795 [Sphingomonadaceae bacterium]|nr:hypothetical protein [Sphingomonadaceae bacterium]